MLELCEKKAEIIGRVQAGGVLVDGLGVGDVGQIVIRDRQKLSEDGLIVVVMTLEGGSNELIAGPEIISRGFVYVREAEGLLEDARDVVDDALDRCLGRRNVDWSKIKTVIKDELSDFVWERTQRRPMILPIIMEA